MKKTLTVLVLLLCAASLVISLGLFYNMGAAGVRPRCSRNRR